MLLLQTFREFPNLWFNVLNYCDSTWNSFGKHQMEPIWGRPQNWRCTTGATKPAVDFQNYTMKKPIRNIFFRSPFCSKWNIFRSRFFIRNISQFVWPQELGMNQKWSDHTLGDAIHEKNIYIYIRIYTYIYIYLYGYIRRFTCVYIKMFGLHLVITWWSLWNHLVILCQIVLVNSLNFAHHF